MTALITEEIAKAFFVAFAWGLKVAYRVLVWAARWCWRHPGWALVVTLWVLASPADKGTGWVNAERFVAAVCVAIALWWVAETLFAPMTHQVGSDGRWYPTRAQPGLQARRSGRYYRVRTPRPERPGMVRHARDRYAARHERKVRAREAAERALGVVPTPRSRWDRLVTRRLPQEPTRAERVDLRAERRERRITARAGRAYKAVRRRRPATTTPLPQRLPALPGGRRPPAPFGPHSQN